MSFNIIDIIIVAILALSMVSGMYKGFMGSILALGGFIGSWFAALATYNYLAAAVKGSEFVMSLLENVLSAVDLFADKALAATSVYAAPQNIINDAVQAVNLPMISDLFRSNLENRAFADLGLDTIAQYLSQTIVEALINVLSFIVAFAVIYFAVLLVVNLLNSVFRFPSLKHLDWLLGGALGVLRGVFIVFLIFAIMPTALTMLESMNIPLLSDMIAQSSLSGFFVNTNFLGGIVNTLM